MITPSGTASRLVDAERDAWEQQILKAAEAVRAEYLELLEQTIAVHERLTSLTGSLKWVREFGEGRSWQPGGPTRIASTSLSGMPPKNIDALLPALRESVGGSSARSDRKSLLSDRLQLELQRPAPHRPEPRSERVQRPSRAAPAARRAGAARTLTARSPPAAA